MRPGRFYTLLLALAFLPSAIVPAMAIDDDPEAVKTYEKGRRLMRQGDHFGAVKLFEQLMGQFPDSPNADVFAFNRAKALYYLGEKSDAAAAFEFYLSRYGDRAAAAHAQFYLGNVVYRAGDATRAFDAYMKGLRLTRDKRLEGLLAKSVETAMANASGLHLQPGQFASLPASVKCRLVRKAADELLDRGQAAAAGEMLNLCGESLDSDAIEKARRQLQNRNLEVAVVLPFSGELRSWAEDINNGVVIAADMYRRETGGKLNLGRYDTKGDPIEAARLVAELSRKAETRAAIGPLTSDAAAVATARLGCFDLPLMIPAATQSGLTQLAHSAFQMSPNIELQGVRMADYAVDSVKADSAIIITSTSSDHLRMSQAFSERFRARGGEVVAVEYYRARDKDFGPYVRDIKAMLLGANPDSTFFITPDGDTLAQDGVSAFVDCLYMPGNAQQLKLLLPQVRFYKLQGAYLGSDGWGEQAVYRLGDRVTRNAVFPSPFIETGRTPEYNRFATEYDARYGQQPTRLACLGYDAMRLLTSSALGTFDYDEAIQKLSRIKNWIGASGRISFGDYRENTEMPLYQIRDDQIYPLDLAETTTVGAEETSSER